MKLRGDHLLLLAILCLGLFVRVYNLGGESLWYDEIISVGLAHMTPAEIIADRAANVHPPLYFLLLRGWVALFGDSERAVRSLSVLFGLLAIFMTYKAGRLLFDEEVGMIASLLLALSPFHIRYCQEARAYSLLVLLTLASFYFFLKLLQEKNNWLSLGYVLSSALLAYTHYYGLFVLVAQNLYFATLLLLPRKDFELTLKRWLILQSLVLLLFAPWISTLFHQVSKVESGYWIAPPSKKTLRTTFRYYAGGKEAISFFFLLAFLSLITLDKKKGRWGWKTPSGFVRSLRQKIILTDLRKIWLLCCWLLIPVFVPYFVSRISTPVYNHRYTIIASLAFYLLIAKGVKNLAYWPIKGIALSAFIILSLMSVQGYFGKVQKEQWKEAARYVDSMAESGDLILFNAARSKGAFEYYSQRSDLDKKPFPERDSRHKHDYDEKMMKQLIPILKPHKRVWLVLSHRHDRKGLIAETLMRRYGLAYHQKLKGIEIYLFEKRGKTLKVYSFNRHPPEGREVSGLVSKEARAG
jgi:mannosyltransferase